jgi:hypothetical protein
VIYKELIKSAPLDIKTGLGLSNDPTSEELAAFLAKDGLNKIRTLLQISSSTPESDVRDTLLDLGDRSTHLVDWMDG